MKNVTITLRRDVAQWVRIWAARENTSVSRIVGEMLRKRMLEEQGYRGAMKRYLSRGPVRLKRSGRYPTREDLHDRDGLR